MSQKIGPPQTVERSILRDIDDLIASQYTPEPMRQRWCLAKAFLENTARIKIEDFTTASGLTSELNQQASNVLVFPTKGERQT